MSYIPQVFWEALAPGVPLPNLSRCCGLVLVSPATQAGSLGSWPLDQHLIRAEEPRLIGIVCEVVSEVKLSDEILGQIANSAPFQLAPRLKRGKNRPGKLHFLNRPLKRSQHLPLRCLSHKRSLHWCDEGQRHKCVLFACHNHKHAPHLHCPASIRDMLGKTVTRMY